MKQYLFVYGTLSPELAPPEIAGTVEKLKFVGEGFVFGRLYDLGEYPAAILDDSAETKVFGRIYELPPDKEILHKLDKFEEFYPQNLSVSLYLRKKVTAYLNDNKLQCWIYEYNGDASSNPVIESGRFSTLQAA